MIVHCAHDEMVDLDILVPNPKNPNKHPDSQIKLLAKIMAHQGWRSPIVVSKRSGFITKGHGRLAAARLNKWTSAPVDRQEYATEADEYADMVADNKIAELSETDLSMVLKDVLDLGPDFDFDMLGIPDFKLPEDFAPGCDEDEVPEHVEPKTKPGDIYRLGNHRLMCGDSTSIDAVEKLMGGEKADFTITSPPYNVGLSYNEYEDNKDEGEYVEMLRSVLGNIRTICTENYWMMWNVGVYPLSLHLSLHLSLLRDYFKIKRSIAWVKQGTTGPPMVYQMKKNPVVKNYLPNFGWEIIACCHLNEKSFGTREIPAEVIEESLTDVWQVSQHKDSKDQGKHPGAFPVKIAERSIQLYAENNVYEPFGGSGSTMIACEKTNRKCFMMEIDPHYCDVIVARWEKFTGKKAELING